MADVTLNIRHNATQAAPAVGQLADEMGRMAKQSKSASTAGTAAANGFNRIGAACLNVGKSAKTGASGISKFTSSLGRVAYYRLIRTAIKYVGDAFRYGLKAAYAFSKANQPADYAKLAGAMDGIKKAASTMSLQLGAAFGGLITTIAPVLIRIINLVTQAAEAITRFFAVLNGSGYYKKAAEGFEEVGESAGGAGKQIKGLLASWDELNVIGKESGGGGGGSSATDYSGAYEWVEPNLDIDPAALAKKISAALSDALDSAITSLENYDWAGLGKKIGTFLANVDWAGIASRCSELLGAALGAIGAVIYNTITEAFSGLETDATFLEKLTGVFDWIIDNVVKPFGEGFLKAAGFDNLVENFDLFADKMKASFGLIVEYYRAFTETLKGNSDFQIFINGLETTILKLRQEVDKLELSLRRTIQENPALRAIFGDQSQIMLSLEFDIQDAQKKIDELSESTEELRKNGKKGFDINANLNKDKVDEYKETLNKPWAVTVEPEVKEPVTPFDPSRFFTHGKVVGDGSVSIPVTANYTDWSVKGTKNAATVKSWTTWNSTSDFRDWSVRGSKSPSIVKEWNTWDSTSNYTDWKVNGSKSGSALSNWTTWDSTANWNSQRTGNKWAGTTWNSTANWNSQTVGNRWAGTTWSSTAEFNARTSDISTTWDATAAFKKYTVADSLKSNGYMKIDATANIKKVTGSSASITQAANGGIYRNGSWRSIQSYAGGGSPWGGQIFRARENGNPELVGTIHGSTAVMNNGQIVSSVSAGVARAISNIHFKLVGANNPSIETAMDSEQIVQNMQEGIERGNAEQNDLLREQNSLLRQLLNKPLQINPSAALGQVVARSADMYARA